MPRKSPAKDFRAVRTVLNANYLANAPAPPARDLVKKATWDDIQILPEIVSIRTSNDHGKDFNLLTELWGRWIDLLPVEKDDIVRQAGLVVTDKLQAATFNALHGYYRTAADCLRSAVEQMTIAAHFQLCSVKEGEVLGEPRVPASFEMAHDDLQAHYEDTRLWRIFEGERNRIGWIRNIHQRLNDYAHTTPGFDAVQVWDGNNGPIYLKSALEWTVKMWLLTYASCLILLRLAQPSTPKVSEIFSNDVVARVMVLKNAADFFWDAEQGR
jgi:hypothetical protein